MAAKYLLCVAMLLCLLPDVLPAPLAGGSAQQRATVFPARVDQRGRHMSFDLSTSLPAAVKGDAGQHYSTGDFDRLYFKLEAFGKQYLLNVSNSMQFISGDHMVEYRGGSDGSRVETSSPGLADCHHTGTVVEEGQGELEEGWVAISNCRGMHGIIATASGHLFIEPVGASPEDAHTRPHQHTVYTQPGGLSENAGCAYDKTSSVQEAVNVQPLPLPGSTSESARLRRSLETLSTSSEHCVEVAVVADHTMTEYHGTENLEAYLFTLMNMVSHIYRDPTIGHAMNIVLVRTIILETQQSGLSISSHALNSLNSFCTWQSSSAFIDPRPDLAILVTRSDICEGFGGNCGTLGIAEFKGACTPHKSCSISEDIGLATAFTIAHEMGHNLGIRHDGDMSTSCEPDNHYIMAPSFAQSHNPHHWSTCSREQLAEFLLSPASACLSNKPPLLQGNSSSSPVRPAVPLPGLEVTATEQCQLMFGEEASHCPDRTDSCSRLWCRENDQSDCDHQHIPPAAGTECTLTSGGEGVCYKGACVDYRSLDQAVDGGWGEWGAWGECSLSCGTGVQKSSRSCDSPLPSNGGRYCVGVSQRFQTCNIHACLDLRDFRQELCERNPPHSRYTEWEAPSLEYIAWRGLSPCGYHCLAKPDNLLFTLMLRLPDGTPCLHSAASSSSLHSSTVPESLGVCVSGECVPVGCDNVLDHMSSRDACGVWCGNGSTCVSVSNTYTIPRHHTKRNGYFYHETVTIPRGSGQVQISELRPTENLYLSAATTTENFNGNYQVEEGALSNYWFAGARWWYERPSAGIECLRTSGVLEDDVTVYIISNSLNSSIYYSAGVPTQSVEDFTDRFGAGYAWQVSEWEACDAAVCGDGVQMRRVECGRLGIDGDDVTVAEPEFCEGEERPEDARACTVEECRYRWRGGEWGTCDSDCGEGVRRRLVECVLTNNDTVVGGQHCASETAPRTEEACYTEAGCRFEWRVNPWSDCTTTCGVGQRTRQVECVLTNNETVADDLRCEGETIPNSRAECYSERGCVFAWRAGEWSDCSTECGAGERQRIVSCILTNNDTLVGNRHCATENKPDSSSPCYTEEGCVYEWRVGAWSSCSVECGQGERSREVGCYLTNNNTVASSDHCHPDSYPRSTSYCYTERGCVFEWRAEPWSDCSATCGGGQKTRGVSCVLVNNRTTVEDSYCSSAARPSTGAPCYAETGCQFEWQTDSWRDCSVICGEGERTRQVVCVLTNNATTVAATYCDSESEPESVSTCGEECRFEWRVGEWGECAGDSCEEGTRSRDVHCVLLNNQSVVVDSYCSGFGGKPAAISSCQAQVCHYHWVVGEWGRCEAGCGEGAREREVYCELVNGRAGKRRVEVGRCDSSSVPQKREPCSAEPCTNFEWKEGDWTECNAECGETGSQARTVSCQHENGTVMPEQPYCTWREKPLTSKTCRGTPCTPFTPPCVDNPVTSCRAIVKFRLCRYYGHLCCRSCGLG